MIPIDEAISTILGSCSRLESEEIALDEALGRLMVDPLVSERDVPGYDNSAMDGICFAHPGTASGAFELRGELPAGAEMPAEAVQPGDCLKIMTGGPVPPGATAVAPREIVSWEGSTATVDPMPPVGANIRKAGEDIAHGSTVDLTGRPLGPGDLGVLASLGVTRLSTTRRPRVAIFGTGSELVEPHEELRPGQVVNSNNWTLAAAARWAGAEPVVLGKAGDDKDALRRTFESAASCDVICSTGGVSVGDYDYVKEILGEIGATMLFWKVALKPGKPLAFGTWDQRLCFGLPGNPVSCLVNFELFVVPAIRSLLGYRFPEATRSVEVTLAEDVRALPDRTHAVRVILESGEGGDWLARTTGGQGSGMLTSMSRADALILVTEALKAGDRAQARWLPGRGPWR